MAPGMPGSGSGSLGFSSSPSYARLLAELVLASFSAFLLLVTRVPRVSWNTFSYRRFRQVALTPAPDGVRFLSSSLDLLNLCPEEGGANHLFCQFKKV